MQDEKEKKHGFWLKVSSSSEVGEFKSIFGYKNKHFSLISHL